MLTSDTQTNSSTASLSETVNNVADNSKEEKGSHDNNNRRCNVTILINSTDINTSLTDGPSYKISDVTNQSSDYLITFPSLPCRDIRRT